MSLLRSIGIGIFGLLFTMFLMSTVFVMAGSQITNYSTIKPVFTDFIEKQISSAMERQAGNMTNLSTALQGYQTLLLTQCQGKESIKIDNFPIVQNLTVNCSDIAKSKPEDIIKLLAANAFDTLYYKKYDCSFLECIQKQQFGAILSPLSDSFLRSAILYLILGTIVSGAIMAFLIRKIGSILKNIGICLIIIGIPFFLMPSFKKFIPAQMASFISPITDSVFASLSTNLMYILIAGVALTVAGFLMGKKK